MARNLASRDPCLSPTRPPPSASTGEQLFGLGPPGRVRLSPGRGSGRITSPRAAGRGRRRPRRRERGRSYRGSFLNMRRRWKTSWISSSSATPTGSSFVHACSGCGVGACFRQGLGQSRRRRLQHGVGARCHDPRVRQRRSGPVPLHRPDCGQEASRRRSQLRGLSAPAPGPHRDGHCQPTSAYLHRWGGGRTSETLCNQAAAYDHRSHLGPP